MPCSGCKKFLYVTKLTKRNGYYCEDCIETSELDLNTDLPCPNPGCIYVAPDVYSLRKHFIWLCSRNEKKCLDCTAVLNDENIFDHFKTKRPIMESVKINANTECVIINRTVFAQYSALKFVLYVPVFDNFFRFFCHIQEGNIVISMITDLSLQEMTNYKCRFIISSTEFPENYDINVEIPNVSKNSVATNKMRYDWMLSFPVCFSTLKSFDKSKHYLKILIKKLNDNISGIHEGISQLKIDSFECNKC